MGKDLADIRANVSTAVDTMNGIKVRGKIKSIGEDEEDSTRVIVTIKIDAKKRKESGHGEHSTISYSIPRRLTEDLEVGREIVLTLTPQ